MSAIATQSEPVAPTEAAPRPGVPGSGSGRTILVAEPDDMTRKCLAYVLLREGFQVREATSVEETVKTAQTGAVSPVLLSLHLHQTMQMNVLTVLKRRSRTRDIPVLMVGQPRDKDEIRSAVRGGASGVLVRKGFGIPAFLERVRNAVKGPRPAVPTRRRRTGLVPRRN